MSFLEHSTDLPAAESSCPEKGKPLVTSALLRCSFEDRVPIVLRLKHTTAWLDR